MNEMENSRNRFVRDGSAQSIEQPPIIDSQSILGSRGEVRIQHEGDVYRLRITRNGRLILNK